MLTEIIFFGVNATNLTTVVFLYQKPHPDDGQISGQNVLVKIL
jgi:hypothetical protein